MHTRAREISRRRPFARARVYFARPTITIAKIRDYSQSNILLHQIIIERYAVLLAVNILVVAHLVIS